MLAMDIWQQQFFLIQFLSMDYTMENLVKEMRRQVFFFHKIHDILFFSNTILGDSHRARIPSIFAAEFSIGGCAPEEMIKTYRLETNRGKYK